MYKKSQTLAANLTPSSTTPCPFNQTKPSILPSRRQRIIRLHCLFFLLASLFSLNHARTTGFTTFDTLEPGEATTIIITTSSYDAVVDDVVMLFGLSKASEWRKGDLGYPFVSTKILGEGN
jgi:hypothetical protein